MLPDGPGTYVLILRAQRPQTVSVGKLGRFDFPPGWYAYAGSARGPGGLAARVNRHASPSKACHWHIDYLGPAAQLLEAWYALGTSRRECAWADALVALPGGSIPAPRFGASDCCCRAHLFHFADRPSLSSFSSLVDQTVSRLVIHP